MPDLRKRIVYQVDAMGEATATRGIPYKESAGAALLMDVYAPKALTAEARLPAVFLVHGGPIPTEMPAPTTWGIFQSYGELLAASGLVGVTFNHRLYSWTDYEQSQADVVDAIDYVRSHAAALNVDAERIGFWVFSGGGPHLSWALRARPSYLRCAAAFYALLDLRHLTPPDAEANLVAAAQALSPITYLDESAHELPLFLARAGRDSEMINRGIDLFLQQAVTANASLDFMNHARGQHAFDGLDDDERSRDIIRAAIAFMRSHLRP